MPGMRIIYKVDSTKRFYINLYKFYMLKIERSRGVVAFLWEPPQQQIRGMLFRHRNNCSTPTFSNSPKDPRSSLTQVIFRKPNHKYMVLVFRQNILNLSGPLVVVIVRPSLICTIFVLDKTHYC